MRQVKLIVLIYMTLTLKLVFASEFNIIQGKEAIKLIGDKNVIFISGDSKDIYESNHIINSVEMYAHHLHHSDKMGNMKCAPLYQCIEDAEKVIRSKGIRNNQLIIAYDNYRGPNATGVYSFFESFGHKNIKLLDGGFAAIQKEQPEQQEYDKLKAKRRAIKKLSKKERKAGNIVKADELVKETKAIKKQMKALIPSLFIQKGKEKKHTPSNYTIDKSKINLKYIADKYEVKKAMEDIMKNKEKSKYVIIDSRGITEIIGERKMDNVARGGHIPGAKFIEWKHFSDNKKRKSFKPKEEMQAIFDKNGVSKDKTIYAYCQVGTGRSSHIIFTLRLLGYKNVKVFTGSWDAWGNDMNLPILK